MEAVLTPKPTCFLSWFELEAASWDLPGPAWEQKQDGAHTSMRHLGLRDLCSVCPHAQTEGTPS